MCSKKEKFLKNINPKLLELTPKLSIKKDSYVDLNSVDSSTLEKGAEELMLRFFKKQELFLKNISNEENIELSDSKYRDSYIICRSISERLSIPFSVENGFKFDKPRKKYQDLKKKLEDEMSARREEEYRKRINEYNLWKNEKTESECKGLKEVKNDEFSIKSSSNFEINKDEEEIATDDNRNCSGKIVSEEQNGNLFNNEVNSNHFKSISNNEAEEVNPNFKSKDIVDEEGNSSDEYSLIPPYQPGGGLMYGGSELTQPNEELPINLLSPSLKFQINESQNFKENDAIPPLYSQEKKENFCLTRQKLFNNSQNSNDMYDLNDALEFCSGKFPISEEDNIGISNKYKHQDNLTVFSNNNEFNDRTVENMENGDYSQYSVSIKNTKTLKRIVLLDDSDEEEENNIFKQAGDKCEESKTSLSKVTSAVENNYLEDSDEENIAPKIKGAKYLLHFSDEEDELIDDVEQNESEDENEGVESCNKSVHYDSEENEIINPKDFFEKEAELSGSEWSGDEDEQGLDDFDEEDGDAEELDYEQIKSQLEKIHMRHLLDKDSKNIRLLQELFFEDGDLHSDGKYKKFKWRNLGKEKNGYIEDECSNSTNIDDNVESDDEDVENLEARKERFERQLLLEKMKEQGESVFDDDLFKKVFRNLKVTTIKTMLKNNIPEEKGEKEKENVAKNSETINISSRKTARGSFLGRNEEFLSRLTKVISNVNDNVRKPNNSKNFVFISKSPDKAERDKSFVSKRMIEDLEDVRYKKKRKTCSGVVEASPFILDLLD